MNSPAPRRRSPVQERSHGTVQRVLSAASSLLAGGAPVEALTTAQIASAAGLSVGALYRFFPDKQAIVDAIAVRHMELFQERLAGVIMAAMPADAPAFLATVIDAFVAYLEANPDFRIIAFGAPGGSGGRYVSRPTRDAYAGAQVAETIQEFVAEAFDIDTSEGFGFRLRIATETGDRLLAFAFEQTDQTERNRIIAETKRLLATYLFGA
jgi:AcrR family transcriptional regulator